MTNAPDIQFLDRPDGERIAYVERAAQPGKASLVWLGGFKSDMDGTKALVLDEWARESGRGMLRFDYFGHGQSSGNFEDGTIGRWREDALAVIDELTEGPQILVGSSMGGWISLLAAKARPERIGGMLLIAPAPDFTSELMWPNFSEDVRRQIMEEGKFEEPSAYDDEIFIVTRKLIEDGKNWSVLGEPLAYEGPVRILQGMKDDSVPWQHAQRCVDLVSSENVVLTLIKNGDHRLSTETDLARLIVTTERLVRQVEAA
ncbi:alpha/beta hydrolase [Hyphobacterium sp. HN65]|uniref:Palmitoyl-protein thioesterase ABHD10, mitochondrial n=1 Tax=Hyphobacterium lacteum TaxID=3116575 RepID=A0ABU7LTS0_9PROT|nr:alpha/beta hydrolase [Hyphobacterium sp. HN65]MEE2527320.1 alpha/beta hydrolase [Hyphobacterium sp. HN65]